MNATLTEDTAGLAWSEDPEGLELSALRIDLEGAAPRSISLPRRGPIRLSQFGDADTLDAVREALLEAERELGGPAVLRWRAYGSGNIDAGDARLIDEPLPWGGGPGRGMEMTPQHSDRWSRANAGEVLPNVMTPLSWSVIRDSLERGFQSPWGEWTSDRRFVAMYDGYVYFNLGLMLELIEQRLGLPSAHFLEVVGGPERAERGSTDFHWPRLLRQLPYFARAALRQRSLPRDWPRVRADGETERDRLRGLDLSELSDAQIIREVTRSAAQTERLAIFLMEAQTTVFGAIQTLLWNIDRMLGAEQRHLALAVLQGLPNVRTQEGNIALRRIAERTVASEPAVALIQQHDADSLWPALQDADLPAALQPLRDDLAGFLDEYGHRAAGELEAAEPRWAEQPSLILGTFREYVLQPDAESTDALIARQRDQRRQAEQQMRDGLGGGLMGELRWRYLRSLIRQAQALQPLRENPKFTLLELSLQQRRLWRELAERWLRRGVIDDANDIYYLLFNELTTLTRRSADAVVAARMRSRVRRRRRQYDIWTRAAAIPLRDRFGDPIAADDEVEAEPEPLPLDLRGIAASTGSAEGRAHVADSAAAGRELRPGQILVARFTDPGWTPIFPLAAAVVTEIGGVLSHGAIVAREFGIPAVVNVQQATQQIHTGDLLRVDGANGQVTILERA